MKKTLLILASVASLNLPAHAQLLKGLGNIVKAKATEKLSNEVDKRVNGLLNGKKQSKPENAAEVDKTNKQEGTLVLAKSYSKYDFIPGEKIQYFENFSNAALGEMPLGWNTSGKGEVVAVEREEGKWIRLYPGGMYLSGSTKPFTENYTIEFDVLMQGNPPSGTRFLPSFTIGLLSTGKFATTHNSFLNTSTVINNKVEAVIKPNVDKITTATLESFGANNKSNFKSEVINLPDFNYNIGSLAHYAIQVQKQRLRFWVNGNKIIDVPQAINVSPALNQLYFKIGDYWMYNEQNFGLYITNVKIASGVPDLRSKLSTTGSFTTTGILFETSSSEITPQSHGLLKEVADVLSSLEGKKIKITGHTDNAGNASANLQLSKKRAEAIGEYLTSKFAIDSKRFVYDGKGATMPVADNKSTEGMAQNRRVEFALLN